MPSVRRSIGRLTLVAAVPLSLVTLGGIPRAGATTAVASATAAIPAPASAALDWIEGELAADGGHLTTSSEYQGKISSYDDWGLTLDAALALAAGGRGDSASATTALAQVSSNISSYVTGASFGAPDDRYAAALAKSTLAVAALGGDPSSVGGMDLPSELRARMQTTGADTGRFTDRSSYGDYSNGIGQALAVMGLARTAGGVPAAAVTFLLAQQCPGGGFRGDYTVSGGCRADSDANVDATSFAVEALTAAAPLCAARSAIVGAVSWLESQQSAAGGFGADGGANTNSSGLAAQALRVAGASSAADKAAGFITTLQLTTGDDSGAIARDQAGYDGAADGISILERDGFRRATGQAVLAFGLPAYSEIGATPIAQASLTPCAATGSTSVSTVAPGAPVTVSGAGFLPGEQVAVTLFSTPVRLATATADGSGAVQQQVIIPADVEPGRHNLELVGLTSGARVRLDIEVLGSTSAPGTLAATGDHSAAEALMALGLLLAGSGLVLISRRQEARV